jgi:hypothetical protein
MSFQIDFNGPVNDSDYYFVAIDTTSPLPAVGPVPIFPGSTPGLGWLTGSATYFVEYHGGQYTVNKIISLQPFQSQPVGTPVSAVIPSGGSQSLIFTINLSTIGATGQAVNVNIITTNAPFSTPRLLDGLGPTGTDFVNVNITFNQTITDASTGNLEVAGDVLDQNGSVQPPSAVTNPLDIVNWSITVTL